MGICRSRHSRRVCGIVSGKQVVRRTFHKVALLSCTVGTSLILSCIIVQGRSGTKLMAFGRRFSAFVPTSQRPKRVRTLLRGLCDRRAAFKRASFSSLYMRLGGHIGGHDLLILCAGFSNVNDLGHRLTCLRRLGHRRQLLIVFFRSTTLGRCITAPTESARKCCHRIVTRGFMFRGQLVISALGRRNVDSILAAPRGLSISIVGGCLRVGSHDRVWGRWLELCGPWWK